MNAKRLSPVQFVILVAITVAGAMLIAGTLLEDQADRATAERMRTGRPELCYSIPAGTWIPQRLEQQLKEDCARRMRELGNADASP